MISFVNNILDSDIEVVCRDKAAKAKVKSAGGGRLLLSPRKWRIHYSSEDQLAKILDSLRNAKIAMAGSPTGWPPSAVFQRLRDEGKVSGDFIEISWSGPGEEMLLDK